VFELDNVELELTEDALEAVAQQAMLRGTGARGLRAILEEVLLEVMYDCRAVRTSGAAWSTSPSCSSGSRRAWFLVPLVRRSPSAHAARLPELTGATQPFSRRVPV